MMTLRATRRKRSSVRMMLMATAKPDGHALYLADLLIELRRDVITEKRPDKDKNDANKDKSHYELTSFI